MLQGVQEDLSSNHAALLMTWDMTVIQWLKRSLIVVEKAPRGIEKQTCQPQFVRSLLINKKVPWGRINEQELLIAVKKGTSVNKKKRREGHWMI